MQKRDPDDTLIGWVRARVLEEIQASSEGYREEDLRPALEKDVWSFPGKVIRLFFTDLGWRERERMVHEAVDYWIDHHRVKVTDFKIKQDCGRRVKRTLRYLNPLDAIVDATSELVLL